MILCVLEDFIALDKNYHLWHHSQPKTNTVLMSGGMQTLLLVNPIQSIKYLFHKENPVILGQVFLKVSLIPSHPPVTQCHSCFGANLRMNLK